MKILELISIPTLTGAGAPMFNLSRRLNEAACSLDIYIDQYRPHNLHDMLAAAGLEPRSGLTLSTIAPPHRNIADFFRLKRIIATGGYSIILCHLSHDHTLAAMARAASGSATPIVRCLHSARSLRNRALQRTLWAHTDAVITHVSSLADELTGKFSFRADRILYLPAEVDLKKFQPVSKIRKQECKHAFGFAPDDFVLGYVARIKPGRRHGELIEAFAAVAEDLPKMRLLIVGDGESLPELKSLPGKSGIDGRVIFSGYLDSRLPEAYQAMDAYIQLAAGNDASCRAVLEAAACDLPVWSVPEAATCACCKIFHIDGIKAALCDIYKHDAADACSSRRCVEKMHDGGESGFVVKSFLESLLKYENSST